MVIDVIIPAFNASATIGRAVASSLAQREVASVIVVDDCSTDNTADAALAASVGDDRLKLERFDQNRGPAAARNHALGRVKAPFVAMVDADDWMRPLRFKDVLASPLGWDFFADNILFVPEPIKSEPLPEAMLTALPDRQRVLKLEEFVERNVSQRGKSRSELGFLKPVFRKELLAFHDLRYAENVRLGEDFLLYAKAMARGAQFVLSQRCGYVAIERSGSLSGQHSTNDLRAFYAACLALVTENQLSRAEKSMLCAHAASIDGKIRHRDFLASKQTVGLVRAMTKMAFQPRDLVGVLQQVWMDKWDGLRQPTPPQRRLLLSDSDFA